MPLISLQFYSMNRFVFVTIFVVLLSAVSYAQTSELASYNPKSIQDEELRIIPNSQAATLTTLPIHPKAQEVSGHTLKQGGFEIKTQVFRVPEKYKKAVKYYQKRIGRNSEFNETLGADGKQKAHFYMKSGSQSRNVIIEEIDKKNTRVTFTIFEGGGGQAVE
jgi:hypothetical protein